MKSFEKRNPKTKAANKKAVNKRSNSEHHAVKAGQAAIKAAQAFDTGKSEATKKREAREDAERWRNEG